MLPVEAKSLLRWRQKPRYRWRQRAALAMEANRRLRRKQRAYCAGGKTAPSVEADWRYRCLRDVFPNVRREHLVDQGLVTDLPAPCFLAELLEHFRINANSDQLTRLTSEGRPPHPPHGLQLLWRRVWDIREVNLSARTPHARGGSLAAPVNQI